MKRLLTLAVASLICVSCSGLLNQVQETAALKNCKFSLNSVQSISLAGINIKTLGKSDLTAANVAKLSAALLTKNIPLDMTVQIGIKNPTAKAASLNTMDWKLDIDNMELANGTTTKKVSIPASSKASMPLSVNVNTYKVFSKDGISSLKNFVQSFSKTDATSSRVAIKVNPTIAVGSKNVKLGYMTLSKSIN